MGTALGIGMTVVGSILDAIGFVLQKKGHKKCIAKTEETGEVHKFIKEPVWIFGFLTCICGSILNSIALGFAAQSLLAPLRSITLVANAILATKFLGEQLNIHNVIGILLVIIGSVGAVVFGPTSSTDDITIEYIKECWENMAFIAYFASLTGLCIIDYFVVRGYEHKNMKERAKESDNDVAYGANFLMISYTFLAAYFGSLNMLFTKSLITMVTSFKADYLLDYFFYLNMAVVVGVNVALEFFRQRALYYFDAIFVVPIFSVLLILGSSSMGGVFFHEFNGMTTTQWIMFPVSIFVTLWGVTRLAYDMGKVYSKAFEKLRSTLLSTEKKISDSTTGAADAIKRWSFQGNMQNVSNLPMSMMSMWGGVSDIGSFRPTAKRQLFRPRTLMNLQLELKESIESEKQQDIETVAGSPTYTEQSNTIGKIVDNALDTEANTEKESAGKESVDV